MTSEEKRTKSEILIHLMETNITNRPIGDLVEAAKRAYYGLHDEYAQLEDLREGPLEPDYNKALDKVAFELANDRTLYNSWRDVLRTVVNTTANKDDKFTIREENAFLDFCDNVAITFLDELIKDVKNSQK